MGSGGGRRRSSSRFGCFSFSYLSKKKKEGEGKGGKRVEEGNGSLLDQKILLFPRFPASSTGEEKRKGERKGGGARRPEIPERFQVVDDVCQGGEEKRREKGRREAQ